MVDEIHTLKEETRGATLEVVIGRMKTFSKNFGMDIRFIAMSATVPNLVDISQWLSNKDGSPAVMKSFGDEYRAVQLDLHVLGYPCTGNEYALDRFLDSKLMDVISQYSHGKPTLVFCATRKSVGSSADSLVHSIRNPSQSPFVFNREQASHLSVMSRKISDKKLQEMIEFGIGFHHGGDFSIFMNLFQ